jgi:putative transcription factor
MQCELCGRDCDCRTATVDGVRMMLCPGCMKYGKGVNSSETASSSIKKPILKRIKRPKVKDVYRDMEKELVSDWNELVKNSREKKGLSREELGFRIGERTVTISKIENGDLRPSDKMIEKLEKELGIKLVEEVASVSNVTSDSNARRGYTFGDFIKKEDE